MKLVALVSNGSTENGSELLCRYSRMVDDLGQGPRSCVGMIRLTYFTFRQDLPSNRPASLWRVLRYAPDLAKEA